jgi:hypothetical protein
MLLTDAGVRTVWICLLLRESDFISLHTPLTRDNRHIIDAAFRAQMKPNAYLVNTGARPADRRGSAPGSGAVGQDCRALRRRT